MTTTAAVVTVPAVVAVLAILDPGVPLARLDLNDGAVWLTATNQMKLGRYNAQIEELNAGLVTQGSTFDVLQDAENVLLLEQSTVSVVDPATVALTTQVEVGGSDTALGGSTVAVVDTDGGLHVRTLATLEGLRVTDDEPAAELGDGGRAVVTRSGDVLAVAPADGTVREVAAGEADATTVGELGAGEVDQLTAVGDVVVVLTGSTLRTLHGEVALEGEDLRLQQPGPASSRVLVASRTALLEVDLDGGAVRTHETGGDGAPAAPVQVGACGHGAWASATGSYARLCDGEEPHVSDLEDMSSRDELVFRVNRSVVVLNDTARGRVWMPLEDTDLRVPNWEDVSRQDDPTESEEETDSPDTTQDLVTECSSESSAPTATDDEFGVRPGRTTVLPVIDNDSSSDCGILVVRDLEAIDPDFGTVEPVHGGRALQVAVSPAATGSVTFTYSIDDGRGTDAPSTGRVVLTVHEDDENAPPEQVRTGSMRVEQGGQATYAALADFADPDSDDVLLVGATTDPAFGTVRFRQDGSVTFRADGGTLGRTSVTLLVSDGSSDAPTEGRLEVDVRPEGSLPPQIDPVHAVTYVEKSVVVRPLDAVRSSGREPARLASVDDVVGATVSPDLQAGTFAFQAPRPGTYYVPFVVAAPPQQATGLARIDVLPWPDSPLPPVAVRDRAFLPSGGEVTVDPLANDSDPAGAVLVLQSVDVPDGSGVHVAVLDHHLVQITAERTLDGPVVLPYEVSNGAASATGQIVVQPVPPTASTQPPVVENVEVTVRTGGVVTIPVLESAYDPDGDPLTLRRALAEPLPEGQGLLFVSGDVLRYQAPSAPLTARATFVVQDGTGNETAATVTVRVHESDASTKQPPRPRDLEARVFEGDRVRIDVPLVGIDPDGDGVTLLGLASPPSHGQVVEVGPDWIEYEAFPGELGTDSFDYAVEDWVGQRAVATIRVGIGPRPPGAAPVSARDDAVTLRPGERIEVRVLANDVDSSGGELHLEPTLEMPEGVDAEVDGRRIVLTAPPEDGVLQIVYTAANERGGRDTAVLTVTVDSDAPVLPPIAKDVVVPASETFGLTEVAVDVLRVAQNPSGPLSDLQVSVPASVASVARVAPDGMVVVTLTEQTQTLPFLLTNRRAPEEASSYAFITVPALGFFRPTPRPNAPELRVASGERLEISLDEQVKVAQGRSATIDDVSALTAVKGTVRVVDEGTVEFTSNTDYAGPAAVTVPVTDAQGPDDPAARTALITLPIEVYAVEDHPPTFAPSTIDVAPGEPAVAVDLRAFTRGPEGTVPEDGRYTYQLTSAVPAGFTASVEGTTLAVAAEVSAPKGRTGTIDLRIGYGRTGSMDATVDLRVIASTRQLARVLDRHVDDGAEGRETTVDVLEDAFNPFPGSPLGVVGAVVETPGAGTASVAGSRVGVRPDEGFIGQLVTRFRVRDVTGDPDREVEGRIYLTVRGVPATPAPPRIGEVRDSAVALSWDAPDSRGATITEYRVTTMPGGLETTCASTACTFDGLANDTEYTFRVAARNAVGWSQESAASASARPDAVPEAPTRIDFVGFGDGSLSWSWPEAASVGSPVSSYTVSISPAPESGPAERTVSSPRVTFDDLRNGAGYSIRVRAHNRAESPGPWTPSSAVQVPAAAPGAPGDLTATRVDSALGKAIQVEWRASADNGDAVAHYEVEVAGGAGAGVWQVAGTSFRFDDASNGVAYTFRVRGHNKAGYGAAAVVTASTFGTPGRPVLDPPVTPEGTGTVELSWAAVDDNGSPVTYEVLDGANAVVATTARTSVTIAGLTGGQTYTFRVRGVNAAGAGEASEPRTATPTTPPGRTSITTLEVASRGEFGQPRTLAVGWSAAPAGGAPSVTYVYRLTAPGRDTGELETTSTSATLDINGWLAPGTPKVTLTVHAVTTYGEGATATRIEELPWGGPPGPVEQLTLTPDSTETPTALTASWAQPGTIGGPGLGYTVCWFVDDRQRGCDDMTQLTQTRSLSDLRADPGQVVRVSVVAENDLGASVPSELTWTVPAAPPAAAALPTDSG